MARRQDELQDELPLVGPPIRALRESSLFATRYGRPEGESVWRKDGGVTPPGSSTCGGRGLARAGLLRRAEARGSFSGAAACLGWLRFGKRRVGAFQGGVAAGVVMPRWKVLFCLKSTANLLSLLGFGLGAVLGGGAYGPGVGKADDVPEGREARAGGGEPAVRFPKASAGASGEQVPCALPYLEVNVVNRETGAPIPTARVLAAWGNPAAFAPCGSGRFLVHLGVLPPRYLWLRVGAPGYGSEEQFVVLDRTRPETVVRLSLSRGIDVTGRVLGPDGVGVRGARVALAPARFAVRETAETHTDDEGVFVFQGAGAPGREYRVAAAAPGLSPYSVRFVCSAEKIDLTLVRRGAPVLVRVVDAADRRSLAGAAVRTRLLSYQAEDEDGSGSEDSDKSQLGLPTADEEGLLYALAMLGSDTLEGGVTEFSLPIGAKIGFSAEKLGWDPIQCEQEEVVGPGGQVVVLELAQRGVEEPCRVLVRDPSGSPLCVEPIFILLPVGRCDWLAQGEEQIAWTDADGYLVLPPLRGNFGFWSRAGVSELRAINLGNGDELAVALRAGEKAAVRVTDEEGASVAGLVLQMRWVGAGEEFCLKRETGVDGFAIFEGLPAGIYALEDANPLEGCLHDHVIAIVRKDDGTANSYSYRIKRRRGDVVVRGVCLDPAGQPAASGNVVLFLGHEGDMWFFSLDPWDEGRFMFRLSRSRWEKTIRGQPLYLGSSEPGVFGYSFHDLQGARVEDRNQVFVRLYRADPGSLSGRIVRSDGSPYRGSVGVLHWARGAANPDPRFGTYAEAGTGETDSRGCFYLRTVPAGLPLCVAVPAEEGEDVERDRQALAVSGRVEISAGEFRDLGILRVERP